MKLKGQSKYNKPSRQDRALQEPLKSSIGCIPDSLR